MVFSLFACDQKRGGNSHIDKFYTNKGGFDLSRFPLLKPYEISAVIPGHDWIITSIDTSEVLGPIPGTKFINVVDSVIFVQSNNTILDGQPIKKAWFVIIPKHHLLRGFKSRQEYLNFLSSMHVNDPKMFDVEEVFQVFDNKDTLDWQELNRRY